MDLRRVVSPISFLSICIAYSAGLIFFAIEQVIENGMVDDFGVIIFWSGIFELLAWTVFVQLPLMRLSHKSILFKKWLFPIVSAVYAEIVFIVLIGWLFLQTEYKIVFWISAVVGFCFGIAYVQLINNNNVVKFFGTGVVNRLTVFIYPLAFLFISFWLFPRILPATAFRFMPDEIQHMIVANTIPKFHQGDSFEKLNDALPNYFRHVENGSGNMSASFDGFTFVVQINCGKIIRIKYSKNRDEEMMIYGRLNESPCR